MPRSSGARSAVRCHPLVTPCRPARHGPQATVPRPPCQRSKGHPAWRSSINQFTTRAVRHHCGPFSPGRKASSCAPQPRLPTQSRQPLDGRLERLKAAGRVWSKVHHKRSPEMWPRAGVVPLGGGSGDLSTSSLGARHQSHTHLTKLCTEAKVSRGARASATESSPTTSGSFTSSPSQT